MAYDDGYYYGQCKIVAVVDNTADNGKTVLITADDNKTYSGTIANKKCEFLLPPRTLYTVQKVSSGSAEFTTKVEAGYGDCILVHLNTGYVEVKQGDIVGLDYIKAATDANLKNKVPEAKAVKELNNSLGGLKFGKDGDGNYGYYGADGSLIPFSQISIGKFTAVNGTKTINVGFKPKAVIIMSTRAGTFFENVYYYDANNDLVVTGFWGSSSSWGVKSLTPTGFTYKYDSVYDLKYIAFKSNQGFPLKANADNIFK